MRLLLLALLLSITALAQNVTIGPAVFAGAGLNDASSGGIFAASDANEAFVATISATGTPDHFTWVKNGSSASSPVAIAGGTCALPAVAGTNGWQALADGVDACWLASTGHTLADAWTVTAQASGSLGGASFVQSGIGAEVARNAQAKLRETVSVADFGAMGTGSDETAKIRNAVAALQSGGTLFFPKPANYYSIAGGLVQIVGLNDILIQSAPGTEIRVAAGTVDTQFSSWPTYGQDSIFRIVDSTNVTLEGLFLNGNIANRTAHTGGSLTESQNSCVLVAGSTNVKILHSTIAGCMTDGVTSTYDASGIPNTAITIEGNFISGSRRCGITSDTGVGFIARGNTIQNTGTVQGTPPEQGICIEPDSLTAPSQDIDIDGNVVTGSAGTTSAGSIYASGFGTNGLTVRGNHIHDNAGYGADFENYDPYATGTVSATNASASISCSGCTWTASVVPRRIDIAGHTYSATFTGATAATVTPVFQQATASGLSYSIIYQNTNSSLTGNQIFNQVHQSAVRVVWEGLDIVGHNVLTNNLWGIESFGADGLSIDGNKIISSLNGAITGNNGSSPQCPNGSCDFVNWKINGNLFRDNWSLVGMTNGTDGSIIQSTSASSGSSLQFTGNKIENSAGNDFPQGGIEITGSCNCEGSGNSTTANLNSSVNGGLLSETPGIEFQAVPFALVNQTPGTALTSANTVAFTAPYLHMGGTAAVQNILKVPSIAFDGNSAGYVLVIADGAWSTITGGASATQICTAGTAITGHGYLFSYDNGTGCWFVFGYQTAASSILPTNNTFTGSNEFNGGAGFSVSTTQPVFFNDFGLSYSDGIFMGSGSPNGVVASGIGSLYLDITAGLWEKVTGVGNTGWQQILTTASAGVTSINGATGALTGRTGTQVITSCSTITGGVPTGCANVTLTFTNGLIQ